MDDDDVQTNGDGDGADPPAPAAAATLASVRDSALELLAGFSRPPTSLRIQVGEVLVEAAWGPPPGPSPSPAATGDVGPGDPAPSPAGGGSEGTTAAGPPGAGYICSPTVGGFYRAPEPGASPFVEVGDTVRVGQQVAIVETMKLMIPVKSDLTGTVVEVLKDDGDSVEHGEPLLAVAPATAPTPRP